jgi:hypothetical protein
VRVELAVLILRDDKAVEHAVVGVEDMRIAEGRGVVNLHLPIE